MFVLLDIDGVMVKGNAWKPVENLQDGFSAFIPAAVMALCKIIEATDADIVLTTSHKHRFSLDEWRDIFSRRGISISNGSSITRLEVNRNNLNRKDEILKWVKNHSEVANFVILDDDKSLNGLPSYLKENLILTSPYIGLTDSEANHAIDLLLMEEFA